MRTFFRRSIFINLLVILCLPPMAHAMRIVSLDIHVDGKPYLNGHTGDNGTVDKSIVWRYFSWVPLHPAPGVTIAPDADNPKRATLKGKITLEARYGGKAEVTELRLIRTDATKQEWTVDPDQVHEIALTIGFPPAALPDNSSGRVEIASSETKGDFPWLLVISVGGVIVVLAVTAVVLLRRR